MKDLRLILDIFLCVSFFFFPWILSAGLALIGLIIFPGYWEFLAALALSEVLFERNDMSFLIPLAAISLYFAVGWVRAFLGERVYYA